MSAIEPTGARQFEAWTRGDWPPVEQTRPGLWSIPVAFADSPLRYTNAYVLAVSTGFIVIDPGYGSDENWELLCAGLAEACCELTAIRAVLVTHYHLDHWGAADRLAAAAGCDVWMAADELEWFEHRHFNDFSPMVMRDWYALLGAPEEELEIIAGTDDVQQTLLHDGPIRGLSNGDAAPFTDGALRVVSTPGHTDGHIAFVHEEYAALLGGDHLLPSFSTNVSLTPFGSADAIGDFLDTFDRLRAWDAYEVHPAHQYRYRGLGARLDGMQRTVQQRMEFVQSLVEEDPNITAWDVASRLPRKRLTWEEFDPLSKRLGLGEAAAYLAHLGASKKASIPWLKEC